MLVADADGPPVAAERTLSPRVWLDVSATRDARAPLFDWLVVRLLAEGFSVTAQRDRAQVELTVAPRESDVGGWQVSASGLSTRRFEVTAAEDPGIARLELLHRSVDALEAVQPRADRGDRRQTPAFALSVVAEPSPKRRSALESAIAVAVLHAGGDLAPRTHADQLVCAVSGSRPPQIQLVSAADECADGPTVSASLASPTDPDIGAGLDSAAIVRRTESLIASALTASELTASALTAVPAEVDADATPDAAPAKLKPAARDEERAPGLGDSSRRDGVEDPVRWRNAPRVLRGGVGVGVLARSNAADLMVAASGMYGREPGVSGWLDVQVVPSRGPNLQVVETTPAAGLRIRALTLGRISLDAGALLGVQLHSYTLTVIESSGFVARDRATMADFAAKAMLGVSVRLWRDSEFIALLRGGAVGRARDHRLNGTTLWSRGAWFFGASVGVNFGRKLDR